MKRNAQKSISSSSAHNICIDHSNICFQCLAYGEIPLTFCLQASHYLAFLLKTSPATKSVVSGLYQGVFFNWKPKWKKQDCLQFSDRAFPTTAWATTWPLAPSCPSEPCSTCCRTPGSSSHMSRQPCSPETFRQVRGTLKCSYWDVIVITMLLGR